MTTAPLDVLLVEDEDTIRTVLSRVLQRDGFNVIEAASAEAALTAFRHKPTPLVVTDIVMDEMTGLELLQEVRHVAPETVTIVMTSHASFEAAREALRAGAYDFLTKPFEDLSVVSTVVARAADKVVMQRRNDELVAALRRHSEELETLNEQLETLATHDGMTGLYNHRHFRTLLEGELARCHRHSHSCSLLFIDVDHFKRFNDRHGHLAGDDLLRQVGELLKERCRLSDIVGRYGGEEFVVLLAETGIDGARTCAESIRSRAEEILHPPGGGDPVTVSVGVAAYPEAGTSADEILDLADRALYRAKETGRNRVVVLEPTPVS